MRWFIVGSAALCLGGAVFAEGIDEVLARSQQQRLAGRVAATVPADAQAQATLRRDLDQLVEMLAIGRPNYELRVVATGAIAETLDGRVILVNADLAGWPEAERLFVLAHELGHVVQGHWAQLGAVYRRHVPGEVTPETTGPVSALLGREASSVSHRHEFEADAFALKALRERGHGVQDILPLFLRMGATGDSASHPAARKRVAQLRALEATASSPSLAAARPRAGG